MNCHGHRRRSLIATHPRQMGHTQPQGKGCNFEEGVLEERLLANMVRWNTGTSEEMSDPMEAQQKTPNPDLDVVRMRATEDSVEGERETGVSGKIEITHNDGPRRPYPEDIGH